MSGLAGAGGVAGAPGLWPWLAGLLGAVWLVAAAWALARGLRLAGQARAMLADGAAEAALAAQSPAPVLVVRADWRVEADAGGARMLGLDRLPEGYDELDARQVAATRAAEEPDRTGGSARGERGDRGGLDRADHGALFAAIEDVRRGGPPFLMAVRPVGLARTVLVRGQAAVEPAGGDGTILLWLFDATETEAARARAEEQRDAAMAAYEAMAAIVAKAPLPIWMRDAAGALVLVNDAYVAAIADGDADAVLAAQTALVDGVDADTALDGPPVPRAATVAGERRRMLVTHRPVAIASGPAGIAGYAVDIEAQDRAEQAGRRLAVAQRDLLDRLSAAVAQFGPDRVLAHANVPWRRLFRLEAEGAAAAGSAPPDFARFLDQARDQGRVPEVRDFPAWRAERLDWYHATQPIEDEWHLRDGTHLRVVAQPTPDGGLLLIAEDRTEQVQLATTRDTLLRVRTATFDNLFEAVAVFAPDGRLHLWNQRFRKLWSADEGLLARHPRIDQLMEALSDRLERPRDAGLVTQIIRAAATERQHRGGAIGFGDGRQFDFASIPLPDGNALFIMIDVTDSRAKEAALRDRNAALEAADRVKTAFLSRMSYELRTPLTAIGGYAEMLAGGYAGPLERKAADYVAAIGEAAGVLGRHIDNLLDLAQGEAGTLALTLAPVSVATLLADAAERAGEAAGEAGIALSVLAEEGAGTLSGDARRLAQLLDQLVGNAVRYTGAMHAAEAGGGGGQVRLVADGDAERVLIAVIDNGPGLPPAPVGLEAGAGQEEGGAPGGGIGLALARQLVAAHGGTLVIAAAPDGGTVVTVTLPRDAGGRAAG